MDVIPGPGTENISRGWRPRPPPAGARPTNAEGHSTIEVARAVLVARHLVVVLAAATAIGSLAISGPMPLHSSQLLDGIEEYTRRQGPDSGAGCAIP